MHQYQSMGQATDRPNHMGGLFFALAAGRRVVQQEAGPRRGPRQGESSRHVATTAHPDAGVPRVRPPPAQGVLPQDHVLQVLPRGWGLPSARCSVSRGRAASAPGCFRSRAASAPRLLPPPGCFGPRAASAPKLLRPPGCFGPQAASAPGRDFVHNTVPKNSLPAPTPAPP